MKKTTKALLIVMLFSFACISCEKEPNEDEYVAPEDAEKVAAAKSELTIPAETDRDLDLPKVLNGVTIKWISLNEELISNIGLVSRPFFDAEVSLIAKLRLKTAADKKEFTVRILGSAEKDGTFFIAEAELVGLTFFENSSSSLLPNWIMMKNPGKNVIFNCTTDNGNFCWAYSILPTEDFVKNVCVYSGELIYWWPYTKGYGGGSTVDHDFVEIVLKLEEHIIGYVVIEIYRKIPLPSYNAHLLKSILFPQVNGEYQNVSEEYIKARIEKIKDESQTDAGKVANIKKNLMINPKPNSHEEENIAYGTSITLRTSLNGVAINWVSSDNSVISSTGLVTRKLYETEVRLTATLTLGDVVDTKEFTITVPARM